MASRMDKYYNEETKRATPKRTARNYNLYNNMSEGLEYSNIEGALDMEKSNEIDLEKIKELLNIEKKEVKEEIVETLNEEKKEEKNYDLSDILKEAKEGKKEDHKQRSLSETHFDFLKDLEKVRKEEAKKEVEEELNDENLKHLLDTITSTKALKNMKTTDLGLNMFEDLKSDKGENLSEDAIKDLIEEAKGETESVLKTAKKSGLDESFYTSSFNFKDEDFEDFKDINDAISKNRVLIRILSYSLLLVVAGFIGYIIFNLVK